MIMDKIQSLLEEGKNYNSNNYPKNSLGYFEEYPPEFDAWVQRVNALISRIFATDSAQYALLQKGLHRYEGVSIHRSPTAMDDTIKFLQKALELSLSSQKEDKFEEIVFENEASEQVEKSNKVFIVHGHDDKIKNAVARFIENIGLEPIILHEQPNKGLTIIEKFENYSRVGFAIVLLTADDVGSVKNKKDNLNMRARQNVIFELGFFIGKLNRQNVCALYTNGVELPSDYSGILYIPIDESEGWKLQLV